MPTETQQLENIESALMQIKSSVNSNKLLSILDVLRDEVNDIAHQHEAIRADIRDLRNLIFQQSSTATD